LQQTKEPARRCPESRDHAGLGSYGYASPELATQHGPTGKNEQDKVASCAVGVIVSVNAALSSFLGAQGHGYPRQ
jgi:hypothetical protein